MYEWNFLWKNGKEEGKLKGKLYLRIFFFIKKALIIDNSEKNQE